ncbi:MULTISPECIES: DUF1707 and DUF4190 domain-containing protein [unclassified Streptomyces]|uniref:DUF1707 and DUF4190 domain-containing protein n=1 Tax=unclassified Streptomyces TaxID=2593676 RepID=UPI002E355247|nr:DUF1707 and DUF4190 domain-containing protein [Streptomyces sp. NBC_01477]
MLAGDADRESAVNVLKDAFTEGRLTQPEYEDRVGRAYQSRTYAELDMVTADIPRRAVPPAFLPNAPYFPPAPPYLPLAAPLPPTNGHAIASLVCGICGALTGGLSSIPAVVLGHMAKSRIRQTGQQGDGLATAGLVLGYLAIAGYAAMFVLIIMFASAGT